MNIQPVGTRNQQERHVQFFDYAQVNYYQPQATAEIRPTIEAERLERSVRNMATVAARAAQQSSAVQSVASETASTQNESPRPNAKLNKALYVAACVTGALAFPAISAATFLGPIGLVIPACLLAVSAILFCVTERPQKVLDQQQGPFFF